MNSGVVYELVNICIEDCIIGFDEYTCLVLDDAEEIHSKTKSRKQQGQIMPKGGITASKCFQLEKLQHGRR